MRRQTTSQSTQVTTQEVLMYAQMEEEALEAIRQRGAPKRAEQQTLEEKAAGGKAEISTQVTSQEARLYEEMERQALEAIHQRDARKQTSATAGSQKPPSQVTSQEARL